MIKHYYKQIPDTNIIAVTVCKEIGNPNYERRCIQEGKYIVLNKCSLRQCADDFGYDVATISRDVRESLYFIDYYLWEEVNKIIGEVD